MASGIYLELLRNGLRNAQRLVNEKTELSVAFRKLVNHPERSDVTFVCKDGKSVHASRFLVSSRCTVLESMLNNGMLESKLTEIRLPEVSSQVLLSVMEYLYTAELVDYPPLTWRMGFEIITAAQFFILPYLEITIRGFLFTEATKAVESSNERTVIEMLNIALEFQESWEGKETVLKSFVDMIGDEWFEESHPRSLSENAVYYIVSNGEFPTYCTEIEGQEGLEGQSLGEYSLLRQIVLWQAYQKVSLSDTLTIKRIQAALPYSKDPKVLWSLLSTLGAPVTTLNVRSGEITSMISSSHDSVNVSVLKSLLEDEGSLEKSLERLLAHINWRRIPVFLLVKVIEPLKLIPSSDLFKILTFHALRRPLYLKAPECNWKHGVALSSDNGLVYKRATEAGFAVDSNPMFRSYGMYEWHFEIKQASESFIEVGFIQGCDNEPLQNDDWTFKGSLWQAQPRTRVLLLKNDGKAYINNDGHDGTEWKKLSIKPKLWLSSAIRFQLIIPEHTCRLRIGEDFEETWTGLPDATYYPALSLSISLLGSVQLKLVRGFDYL